MVLGLASSPLVGAGEGTADAVLLQATSDFNAGRFAEAAAAFQKFLDGYGQSEEGRKARERILPLLTASLLQIGQPAKAEPLIEAYLKEYPQGKARADMMHWQGVVFFQQSDWDQALNALLAFQKAYPGTPAAVDAEMLVATCQFQLGKFAEAAAKFATLSGSRDRMTSERAGLMQLQALLEGGKDDDAALRALEALRARREPVMQQALLSLQALKLGDAFYDAGRHAEALRCYRFVPPLAQIEARQAEVLAQTDARLAKLTPAEATGSVGIGLRAARQAIEREKGLLAKVPAFDLTRLVRVAQCAGQMERWQEALLAATAVAESQPRGELSAQGHYLALLAAMQLPRYDRAVELVGTWVERYPNHARTPQVAAMEGEALMEQNRFADARAVFVRHAAAYPGAPMADRVLFLGGYCALYRDQFAEATKDFDRLREKFPKSPLVEQAAYWVGMSAVFAKDYAGVRDRMASYLKAYPEGVHAADAEYRRAAALMGLKDYEGAATELRAWLKAHGEHSLADEVNAQLGDALFATGDLDEGIAAYLRVGKTNRALFEFAQFQIGKAYRLADEPDKMVSHFTEFIAKEGDSPRVAEALQWIGWAWKKQDKPEEARKVYAEALTTYGNDRMNHAVEDIQRGMARLYAPGPERDRWLADLRTQATALQAEGRKVHAARNVWLLGQLLKRSDPEQFKARMLEIAHDFEPKDLSARVMIDLAEFQIAEGRVSEARTLYAAYASDFPKHRDKDRALAGLGLIAAQAGDEKTALGYFERFEKEAGYSSLMPRVLEARSKLLADRKDYAGAAADLERILALPSAKGQPWARALFQLGELSAQQKAYDKAHAYYQRIYVMYGRYRDWVAKAYLACGRSLEKLDEKPKAVKTYEEMLAQNDLAAFPEYAEAQKRLKEIQ